MTVIDIPLPLVRKYTAQNTCNATRPGISRMPLLLRGLPARTVRQIINLLVRYVR